MRIFRVPRGLGIAVCTTSSSLRTRRTENQCGIICWRRGEQCKSREEVEGEECETRCERVPYLIISILCRRRLQLHRMGGKNAKSDIDKEGVPHPSMAGQVRFSVTSGAALQPSGKKTWSIPESNEKTSRGGQRHRGRKADRKGQPDDGWAARKQHSQFTPSGANAIVVG